MGTILEHPKEVAPGNVVRLKEPYVTSSGRRGTTEWTHGIVAQVLHSGQGGGVRNPHWRLGLYLYNPATFAFYVYGESGLPAVVDFGADELILAKLAGDVGSRDRGHDLYPTCGACREGWVVDGHDANRDEVEQRCQKCGGFGSVFAPLSAE